MTTLSENYDIAYFRSVKNLLQHPLKYADLPSMVARALELGASEVNIKSGFKATGVWPIDPNIFQDIDFLLTSTTDRPCPEINDMLKTARKEVVEV